jgi:hypothetical protein
VKKDMKHIKIKLKPVIRKILKQGKIIHNSQRGRDKYDNKVFIRNNASQKTMEHYL